MNIKEIIKTCEVPVAKLSIKNKGSFVKLNHYYTDAWNTLAEDFGLVCREKSYKVTNKGQGVREVVFKWVANKDIDGFSRINFSLSNNCFRVTDEKVLGIFILKYVLELDYKRVWRDNPFLNSFLPYYIQFFYRQRIQDYADKYKGEFEKIEKTIRKLLNMAVFE